MKKCVLLFLLITGLSGWSNAQTYFTFDSLAAPPYICQAHAFNVEVFGWKSSMAVLDGSQTSFIRNDTVFIRFYFMPGGGPQMPYPLHRQLLVLAPPIGRYHLLVQGFYDGQLHKTLSKSLTVCSAIASFKPEMDKETLQIFPNPTSGFLQFIPETSFSGKVLLTDATGKRWLEQNVTGKQAFDLRNLPAGLYFLETETLKGKSIRTILKH